jgi:hypothetical protein
MNCPLHVKEGAEILLDYCSRRMDPDRMSEIRIHVADCVECRQVVEAQEAVWNALDSYEALPVSRDFDRRLWAKIDAEDSQSWWQHAWTRVTSGPAIGWSNYLFNWKPMLVAATACAAMAGVMVVSMPPAVRPIDPGTDQKQLMERVERALDDVDMLNQVGVIETAHPAGTI